ncbi:MAG: sensor histidine kinase, partial [Calditrichaeota bacterium]
MRNKRLLTTSIVLFVLAQVTWFSLLGLFIYRFVMSRNLAEQVEGQLSIAMDSTGSSLWVLIFGCLLYVAVSVAMSIIFKNLGSQLRLTGMYDTFIANITHELKSPLASLQLYLETFKLRNVPPDKQAEFIDLMLKDSNRLKNLINSILKIAVLEKKKEIYDFSIVNVDQLARRLVIDLQQQFKLPAGTITIIGSAPCECVIDENTFKIVFNNLIENAMKYSNKPVKIVISLHTGAKNVQISYQDNGIGIPVKKQKR